VTEPPESAWRASLGAWPAAGGTAFRVWAPRASRVDVLVERATEGERSTETDEYPLDRTRHGVFAGLLSSVVPGDRYRYRLDGGHGALPDPAARFLPDGVHGPAQVIDPSAFRWTDPHWAGLPLDDAIFYELHVGTFSPEGTFAGAAARLPQLTELGVTAVELMPVGDFPGSRNWGYDGVGLFAPARCYGAPDDLRRLVDAAHGLGLAVFLDVVYNHLGPDGNYLSAFSPDYFTERHHTPWGAAINFDGEHSRMVREFFIENALHWVHEYHVDGLRLDATHAIMDDGRRHFLAELTARVHGSAGGRHVLVVAEDHRNLRGMLEPESRGGWGLDGAWADDFHHQCRRLLAGDSQGYYRDFSGSISDLATTLRRGWFFTGQFSTHMGEPRGTDPAGIPLQRFVICLQNHDQVGNRATGERLHHQIELAAYRAATTVLLLAPETPLLFMGQEWAAGSPFLYFTDHHPELGRLVTEGRRNEFRHFEAFSDPAARERIPDPQASSTFLASRLRWEERTGEPHASTLRLYTSLLGLRRRHPALRDRTAFRVEALDEGTIAMWRGAGSAGGAQREVRLQPDRSAGEDALLIIARLTGSGALELAGTALARNDFNGQAQAAGGAWELLMTTEDAPFDPDPAPARIEWQGERLGIRFARPGAVVLQRVRQ
jgi:maltooligosyltrehalose trehalohydrolase